MSDLRSRIAGLSPEQRALFEARLRQRRREQATQEAIRPHEADGPVEASFAQQRLWFLDQLEPGSTAYSIPGVVHLQGCLDVASLRYGLNEIVHRHEVLRTTFSESQPVPLQIVQPHHEIALPVEDLRDLPSAQRKERAHELAREDAQTPFDLERGPLVRAKLVRLADEEHLLLLTLHHIVADGWSMRLIARELGALYAASVSGAESPLEDLPIQYGDYAAWQRERLQGELLERELTYWRGQLGGELPVLELPTDRARPAVQSWSGAIYDHHLAKDLSDRARDLGRSVGATPFMTVVAAFSALLHRYTGDLQTCLGTPVANRGRGELEDLIGFFVNTLVLRVDLDGEPTFRDLLGRVRETALGAYAHQELPFEMVVEEVAPERNLNRTPLFQVMVSQQEQAIEGAELPGLTMSPRRMETSVTKFDLTLDVTDSDDGFRLSWEYSTELFDRETIERMAGHLVELIRSVVQEPDMAISAVDLLGAQERRQLLVDWNNTAIDFDDDECFHQAFESQVSRTPDAPAVVCGADALSYLELNARANQLSHHLSDLGVQRGELVGICLERSVDMVAAVLAVLKAGLPTCRSILHTPRSGSAIWSNMQASVWS